MKLLPVKQVKESNDSQVQRDIIRIQDTKEELKRVTVELQKAEAAFDVVLANQHIHWINEETEHDKIKTALLNEITVLERRRAELRIPIEKEKEEAHTLHIQAERIAETNIEKEAELDELESYLQERIDEISEQVITHNTKADELFARESGLVRQEEMMKKTAQGMTLKFEEMFERVKLETAEMLKKDKALQLRELSITSKEESLAAEHELIRIEKIRLRDERETLERAMNRLK